MDPAEPPPGPPSEPSAPPTAPVASPAPATAPVASPAPVTAPPVTSPAPGPRGVTRLPTRPAGRIGQVATTLAVASLVGFAIAAVLFLIPVETPGVQDCGTPAGYLLDGRVDQIPDPEGRIRDASGEIVTLDPDVAAEARETPCQDRVAARAVPAAGLTLASLLVGMIAFGIELFAVRPRLRHALTTPPDER